jgi:hypothetical protein
MKKFSVKIPQSKKTIFLIDKSYFLKLPETVFSFSVSDSPFEKVRCQMRCFFYKNNNLYFCLFPNIGIDGEICFDNSNHYDVRIHTNHYSEKIFVSWAINSFFSTKFSTPSRSNKYYLLNQGVFNHNINKKLPYVDDIYSYWEKNSRDENFCILNNENIVSKPLNLNPILMKHYQSFFPPNIADIPYLKDYLEEKKDEECTLLETV